MVLQTHPAGIPPAAYRMLADYLRTSGSTLSTSEALSHAITDWIAAQRKAAEPVSGYQWKCLFLPSGSSLRMQHDGACHYAHVVGEQLLYQGRPLSPHQITLMLAGPGRNAWREFWVKLHGEKQWVQSIKLRRAQESRPVAASPLDAMAAAARTMSDALQTTLTLVQHVHHKATTQLERRLPKHRRMEDCLTDD